MNVPDFASLYSEKALEYVLAVGFLGLFVPFWRYVSGTAVRAPAQASAEEPLGLHIPDAVWLHPGHAWARVVGGDVVRLGLDDFAHRLVGAIRAIDLPEVGEPLGQGEKAWTLQVDGHNLDMLAPVDGTVLKVNERAVREPAVASRDPYGDGWLVEVKAGRLAANLRQLAEGPRARRWLAEAMERIEALVSPPLGQLAHDGGTPVVGLARSLSPGAWPGLARRFFLTCDSD